MIDSSSIVVAAASITGAAIAAVIAITGYCAHHYRSRYLEQKNVYTQVLDRALRLEAEKSELAAEHGFLKQTIVRMMQSPVVATLSDQQAQNLLQGICGFLNANKSGMN